MVVEDFSSNTEITEAEKSILSSVIYFFPEISEIVNIDTIDIDRFISPSAKRVFQTVRNTNLDKNGRHNPLLIINNLKKFCVNTEEFERCSDYLRSLSKNIQYFSIKKYLDILRDSKIKRDLDDLSRSIIRTPLSSEDFGDVLENWSIKFKDIVSSDSEVQYLNSIEAVKRFDNLVEAANSGNKTSFLKTHYGELDKKIKALCGGQLVVIASRPGVGKTTFSLNLIRQNFKNISKSKILTDEKEVAAGIFSLEMTTESLVEKLIAIDSKLKLNEVQKLLDGWHVNEYERQLIEKSKKHISNLNLLFCDEANITISRIVSTIRAWVKKYDLKFVVIDYLQLVNIPDDRKLDRANQYQKIGVISRRLKILSMELNICIVALAQLNRKAEERKGAEKSPILSDLRESGSIEQDADIVMFLYEEKNKAKDADDEASKSLSLTATNTMLKIAKNRHGPVGTIEFVFDKSHGTYELLH